MATSRNRELPLEPIQRRAAEESAAAIVVEGGPGTGKTHTMVGRIDHLLGKGVSPDHITYLTFSSRCADDMRRRLEGYYGAGGQAQGIFLGTMHQYANHILRNGGANALRILADYTIWDLQHAVEQLRLIWPDCGQPKPEKGQLREALGWHGLNERRWSDDSKINPKAAPWLAVEQVYTAEKRRQGAVDPDDLINLAIRFTRDNKDESNLSPTRHLLIDEFQELTLRQLELLLHLIEGAGSLMVATDPNQCIHRTEGSRSSLTEDLALRFRSRLRRYKLKTNELGSWNLWQVATTVNSDTTIGGLQYDEQEPGDFNRGDKPRLVEVKGTRQDLYTRVLDDVLELVARGIAWEEIACLYRWKGEIDRLKSQLIHRDVPYTALGEDPRLRAGDTRCLVAMLTGVLNPWDLNAIRIAAAPGYPNRGRYLNDPACRDLRRLAGEQNITLIQAAARRVQELDQNSQDFRALSHLTRCWFALDRLLTSPGISLHDLCLEALKLIRGAQPPGVPPAQEPEIERVLTLCAETPRLRGEAPRQHLARFLDLLSPALYADRWSSGPAATVPAGHGMTVSTIHGSKGKQWKYVFVLDASDQAMPGDVGSRGERVEEEHRIFYVAATRATAGLSFYYLADGGTGKASRQSRFLAPLEPLLEQHY